MRRQKCDRNIPCGRCVKRGDSDKCTREWPEGGYDPKLHRIYPRSSAQADGSPSASNTSPAASIGIAPETPLHQSIRSPTFVTSRPSSLPQLKAHTNKPGPPPNNGPASGIDHTGTGVGLLPRGPSKPPDFPMEAVALLKEPHNAPHNTSDNESPVPPLKEVGPDWDVSNEFAAQVSGLQLLLPRRSQIFQLVEYHIHSVLWYHACFHAPTFCEELENAFKGSSELQLTDLDIDLRWTALLFAIMAGAMTCASEKRALSWGFKKSEKAKLTRKWYKATVTCLNLADYMWRHHIYSVEAITVLTMSAHIPGFSHSQTALLGAALKIAQSLGLQRLGPEQGINNITGVMTPTQRADAIRRETGRRVWSQLCIQDWFTIPFSEMYSIQKLHFTSRMPMNCDDLTMLPLPDDVPGITSFSSALFELASLMTQIHDAIISSNTQFTKYEQVLEYDRKLRKLADEGLPRYFSMGQKISPDWPPYVLWARRSLKICFAHKVIMIHRGFLGPSFEKATFAYTRSACMAAAKTILKEARQAYDEDGPQLWIDQAFMVAAGITLAMDIFYRKPNEPEHAEHRKLVENTISMLGKFDNSVLAHRGTWLLSSMLAERSLENYRKRTHDSVGDRGQPKKPKFNVPKFVESANDSFTNFLRTADKGVEPLMDQYGLGEARTPAPQELAITSDLRYETFEQLFPPQTGISNNFLFEDLLNFDI